MGQTALDIGGFDTRDLDASTGRMRRVLTLIHDKAPSDQIDPELDAADKAGADLVLRLETGVLSTMAAYLTAAEGGVPMKPGFLLDEWDRFDTATASLAEILKFARRLKSQAKEGRLRGRINRLIAVTERVLAEKRRIGSRLRAEVGRLAEINVEGAMERQSALLYMAALARRGLEPKILKFSFEDGLVTPVVGAVPPNDVAADPARLLAFEDDIHDEVETAAPHLVGRTAIWWTDANAAT